MSDYKLVFSGDILPGHEPDTVRQALLGLLKLGPEHAERVFSGQPVVIKKGIDADTAQRYRRKLAAMGIGIRVESTSATAAAPAPAQTPASAPRPTTDTAAAAAVTPPPTPAEMSLVSDAPVEPEQVTCPECGHTQAKRTLCLNCGCDMPRVRAAREHAQTHVHSGATALAAASMRIHDDTADAQPAPRLLGAGFEGRISRRSYFAGSALMMAIMAWALLAAFRIESVLMMGLVTLAAMFFGLRLAVLRCHDFDWRGWWVLIMLVPYVGALFSLLLTFFPGSRDTNSFGARPVPTSWPGLAGALVVLVVSWWGAFSVFSGDIARLGTQYGAGVSLGDEQRGEGNADALALAHYDPSHDRIVMYSLTTCGYCDQKRAQFNALGVRFHEVFIDTDAEANRSMWSKLRASGWKQGGVGTPTLEVNGVMLPNNPSLTTMSAYFLGPR